MSIAGEFWNAFESALGQHLARLPAGATADSLTAGEKRFGISFSDSLHQLFFRHDGSGACFLNCGEQCHYLMSTAWMVAVADQKQDSSNPSISHRTVGPVSSCGWDSDWVPIATNTDGDYLLIDFSPPESGTVGQLIYRDHEGTNSWVAESVDSWLESMTIEIANANCTVVYDEYA